MKHVDPSLPKPFPRAVEVDKPEGGPYRIVSVAQPLGESAAPLLDEVLSELSARGETEVLVHTDVASNHFVADARHSLGETGSREFFVVQLKRAEELLLR